MPVMMLKCPECGHTFQGFVLPGTREPEVWICSHCGSEKVQVVADKQPPSHPWEGEHGVGLCPCCS